MTANNPGRHVLVVSESMFGNTETVAAAIAEGLADEGCVVDRCDVNEAPATLPADLDLLVVGAPTHAFSLSWPASRAKAAETGGRADRTTIGVREWLATVAVPEPTRLAVFDTRARAVRWLPWGAASAARRLARAKRLVAASRPESFMVTGTAGPLQAGEQARAEQWGHALAR